MNKEALTIETQIESEYQDIPCKDFQLCVENCHGQDESEESSQQSFLLQYFLGGKNKNRTQLRSQMKERHPLTMKICE